MFKHKFRMLVSMPVQVMLGFQHADLNFPAEFHHDDLQDLGGGGNGGPTTGVGGIGTTPPQATPMSGNWPSCAQQNVHGANSVTSTTGKKTSEAKSTKKNDANSGATKKKKTRRVLTMFVYG